MRRVLWVGAFVVLAAAASCNNEENGSNGNGTLVDGSAPGADGGTGDESGSGDGGPTDKAAPTFAGVESVTALGESQIAVTWKPASDDVTQQGTIAYRVYLAQTAGGQDFAVPVVTTPAGATGATVINLTAAKDYFVVVRSIDGVGNEDTNTVEKSAATTDVTAPTFGGAKDVKGTGANEVEVSWDPASDNGSDAANIQYEVYASASQGGQNFASPNVVSPKGASSVIVGGLAEAKPVFVIVRAVDAHGNRDINGRERSGNTLDKTPPTFAGLTTAVTSGTTINLTWAAASDNVDGADYIKYDVFRSTTAGSFDFTTPTYTTLQGATSHAATGLGISTTYHFVVRAHDTADNIDANLVEKSATTAASPDVAAPTFAGVATATPTTDQTIDLSWTAATDDYTPAAQIVYDIFMASASGGQTFASPSFTSDPGATGFTVTGLQPLQKQYFVVRARDQAGNINTNTVEKNATTLADLIVPSFGGLATATTTGPTSILLNWAAATDDITPPEGIKYRVFRATAPGAFDFSTPLINVAAGQTQVTVTGLAPNTKYYFTVRAVDEANNVDGNTIAKEATTDPDVTDPTFGGAQSLVSPSPTSVTVSWLPATDDVTPSNQIVYRVFLATASGGQTFAVPTVTTAAGATSATITGLTQDTMYYAVVRARDAAGRVDTNAVEVSGKTQADTTPPTFAGAASVGSAGNSSLTVQWLAASDNVTPPASIQYLVCVTPTNGGCSGASFTTSYTVTGGLSRVVTGLTPDTQYYFVVRARDAYNNTNTNNTQVTGATIADSVDPGFAGLANAVSNTPTTINLTWAAGTDDVTAAGQLVYDIYQANASGGQLYSGPTYTTAAGATGYQVTGLLPGQVRYFVVRARDQAGNSDNNVIEKFATVMADTTDPVFAGVQSVTATGLTTLQAGWNAGTDNVTAQNALVYQVCWAVGNACTTTFTAMATTAAGATSYGITGLTPNTTYSVVVRARDAYNNVDNNVTVISRTTLADTVAPSMTGPPSITGSTSTSLTVSWPTATDNYYPAASITYLVCRSTSPTGCQGANFSATATVTNQNSTTFNSLVNGTTYYFVVRPRDPVPNTDTNNTQVSGQPANDTTNPTFGGLVTAVPAPVPGNDVGIQLSWAAGSDDVTPVNQLVYDIYQASSSGGQVYTSPTASSAAGATTHTITGLTPSTTYYFVVRARDQAGRHDTNVTQKLGTTDADLVKPTFAGISALNQISNSQLQAVWPAATDDSTASSAMRYQVCWNTSPTGCTNAFTAMHTTAANVLSYTVPVRTLVPNTSYTFVVRAMDAYNNVDLNTATATQSTVPDTVVPTFGGATGASVVDYNSITINWLAGADDYTTTANMRYAICVTQANGGCNAGLFSAATTVTNQTSHTFNALTPNTQYYFVVRAQDQANNFNTVNNNVQVAGATVQETNDPVFTAGLTTATAQTPNSIKLDWTNATDDYSAPNQIVYNIYYSTVSGGQNFGSPNVSNVVGVAGANTYTVSALSPGTQYCFVVRAKDQATNEDNNVVQKCATTPASYPSFTAQPNDTSTTSSSVSFSWATTSTPVITINHEYCYSTNSTACLNFTAGTGTNVGTATSAVRGGLNAATTYYFVVRASNATGSTWSNTFSATTLAVPPSLSGNLACGSNNQFPSYLYIRGAAETVGTYPIAERQYCVGGGCLFGFTDQGDIAAYPNYGWIGSPAPWNPPADDGIQVNGPALSPYTTYTVYERLRDTAGNYSNLAVSSGTCKTPVSNQVNMTPYFNTNCNGCHTVPAWSRAQWLGAGGNNVSSCSSQSFVVAGNAGSSYVYKKVGGLAGICGSQMAVGNPGVGLTLLGDWINQGARNN